MPDWKSWVVRSAAARCWLTAAALVGGCTAAPGPVFGEWQGEPPGASPSSTIAVDLVLYGETGASSGRYYVKTTMQNPNQFSNHGTQEWGGDWTSRQGSVDGVAAAFITLHDHLPDQIGGYALAADGRLHALDPNGSFDHTPAGALYTLSPVRPHGAN